MVVVGWGAQNQVIEDLARQSHAITAYWGVASKIETQIDSLLLKVSINNCIAIFF
jgi:hypothetical protein